ncbi:DUF1697 domain-containing protein [Winogradskyella jejuensis]|uniref:Uncharacterized conserved protein, DUF1697 family n=1 Tax=Winogradskyella jejuensis TaxID=1089305 RepID=A0A1M5PD19_9FLAO|nr:DUF1697 domain-containing protein [Winogradskyella jejuensis]SHG99660.1 Uncharacterized conserved protein, DUF1697 family [Winogradskyella jejuensis]
MSVFVVLLRGINVGGHRKVPMAELRELLANSGYANVQTYIQSGNVVLQSTLNSEDIKLHVEEIILNHFGFEVTVLVKTYAELKAIFDFCPFQIEEKEKSYFMMLDAAPNAEGFDEVSNLEYSGEKVYITEKCIYFFSTNGYGRTKFNSNFFERRLKVNATARNHKTMLKLLAIAKEAETKL